jgi:hypothetical protein
MATNYTFSSYTDNSILFRILKTRASNIQLVSVYKDGSCQTVKASGYYGMNASFFNSGSNKAIQNVAVQNGKTVGTGQLVPTIDNNGWTMDGGVNLIGSSAITWNGSALNWLTGIHYSTDSGIPMASNTWAQGGIGLYLCDQDWKNKYLDEFSAEAYPPATEADARTGILINKSTKYVYLFATSYAITVSVLRTAMMNYAGLTEGGSAGSWAAILTDGGRSTQLYCGEGSMIATFARAVPQIIALRNET